MADTRDFLIGLVIGSAIGAAAALLYAPAAGADTRRFIRDKAGEAAEKTGELAHTARVRTMETAAGVQKKAGEVVDGVRQKASEVGEDVTAAIDRGRHMIDSQREAIKSAIDAGRSAYSEKQSELQTTPAADGTSPAPAV